MDRVKKRVKAIINKIKIPIIINDSVAIKIIALVDKILAITKDDDYLGNSAKQAKVCEYEKQIEQLVYELYGLTPEEIEIVENASNKNKVKHP